MIKSLHKAVVKVFFVPYDFREMPMNSRTFIRQKTFLIPDSQSNLSASLRHAVHLYFICLPMEQEVYRSRRSSQPARPYFASRQTSPLSASVLDYSTASTLSSASSSTSSKRRSRKIQKCLYLHKSIRVVFGHRILEAEKLLGEKVQVVQEGPHGVWADEHTSDSSPDLNTMFPSLNISSAAR